MHKHEPKQECNQAILARVKKEMDEPHMAESTRGEAINQIARQKLCRASLRYGGFRVTAVVYAVGKKWRRA